MSETLTPAFPSRSEAMVPTLPVERYVDPRWLDAERREILPRGWHYLGDAGVVRDAGTFATFDLAGTPVVVTRDRDGALRGLVNACRHRGALVAEGCGSAKVLMCRYHGWSYRLDGTVNRTPGMSAPPGTRLPEVRVCTLGPLLFATTDPHAAPLDELLGEWLIDVETVSRVDLSTIERRDQVVHRVRANWKAVVENFIECYHCPLVHRDTLPLYGGSDYRVDLRDTVVTQRLDADRFTFAFLFPNTQISVYGNVGAVVVRSLDPQGVDATHTTLDYWFAPTAEHDASRQWVEFFERVIGEDEPMCESVQRGMSSGHLEHGYLHPEREGALAHFHDLVRAVLPQNPEYSARS